MVFVVGSLLVLLLFLFSLNTSNFEARYCGAPARSSPKHAKQTNFAIPTAHKKANLSFSVLHRKGKRGV